MKLKTIIVLALAATISASAGAFDREEILKEVAKANAQMPTPMGMMGTMTSVSVVGDTVVYNMTIDGYGTVDLPGSKSWKDVKKLMFEYISFVSDSSEKDYVWFESIADCDMYVKYHYLNPHTKKQSGVVLSPDELTDALYSDPDYKFLADYMVKRSVESDPVEMGFMTIMGSKLEGNNIVSTVIVDEDVMSIEGMIENQPLMKENYLQTLKSGTEIGEIYKSYVLAKAGYTQVIIYKGSQSNKQVSYQVTPEDILSIIDL